VNLDPEKVLVLFVIALLVLGPDRLPKAARSLGKALAEVRKYTSAFQSEVNQVLAEPRAAVQSALQEADLRDALRPPLDDGPASLLPSPEPEEEPGGPVAVPDDPGLN
jgi:sec-independent protein translocase protein TatB